MQNSASVKSPPSFHIIGCMWHVSPPDLRLHYYYCINWLSTDIRIRIIREYIRRVCSAENSIEGEILSTDITICLKFHEYEYRYPPVYLFVDIMVMPYRLTLGID